MYNIQCHIKNILVVQLPPNQTIEELTSALRRELDRLGEEIDNALKLIRQFEQEDESPLSPMDREISQLLHTSENNKKVELEDDKPQEIAREESTPPSKKNLTIKAIDTGEIPAVRAKKVDDRNAVQQKGYVVCPSCGAVVDGRLVVCVACGEFLSH